MIKPYLIGLMLLSLSLLSACTSVPKERVSTVIVNNCPVITPCILRAVELQTNDDLIGALVQTEEDWAMCAAKVDMVVGCQEGIQNAETK